MTPKQNKRKGYAFEHAVVEFLKPRWPKARRGGAQGANDCGDVLEIPEWTLELKNTTTLDLAGAIKEAKREQSNAKTRFYAAVIKARGKSAGSSYAVMDLEQLAEIMQRLEDQ